MQPTRLLSVALHLGVLAFVVSTLAVTSPWFWLSVIVIGSNSWRCDQHWRDETFDTLLWHADGSWSLFDVDGEQYPAAVDYPSMWFGGNWLLMRVETDHANWYGLLTAGTQDADSFRHLRSRIRLNGIREASV